MKRIYKFNLAALTMLSTMTAFSAPLSPEAALQRVEPGVRSTMPQLVHTVGTPGQQAAVYVFNRPDGGFMVVSADDSAYALLGYSDTGFFDVSNVPPQLMGWLEGYTAQIDAARAFEATRNADAASMILPTASAALKGLPEIDPLVKTKWNQDAPYNTMCPEVMVGNGNFKYCYSGCVATSMAQVMNYFQYPDKGKGSVQYTPTTLNEILSMNFEDREFDWNNMLREYKGQYSTEAADAVAYLMKACGYSVEMEYSTSDSGAMSVKIVNALINNFQYDDGASYLTRLIYSDEEWARIIYDNLANIGPVIYDGTAPFVGGHSFVCDGYDGRGYFHFNWGWGGLSDGYFSLEALNPTAIGIGGFAGGFNVDQNIVAGIRKPDGTSHKTQLNVLQHGSVTGSIEKETSIKFGAEGRFTDVFNYSAENLNLKIGGIFECTSGDELPVYSEGKVGGKPSINIKSYAYYTYTAYDYPVVPIPEGLSDGTYRVYLATLQEGFEDAQWLPIEVRYGNKNYVMLTVEDGKYSIEDVAPADIIIDNAWFDSDIVYGRTAMFHIKLTNTGDVDITRPYYPVFSLNDDIVMMGDTRMLTIPANSTLETEWEIGLTRLAYGFYIDKSYSMLLWVADADAGIVLESFGVVKIKPAPTNVRFTVDYFEFEGDDMKTGTMDVDGKPKDVFIFPELNNMTLRITATPDAYFDGELFVTASGAGSSEISTGITEVYRKSYELNKNVRINTRIKVSYPDAEAGTVYSFKLYSQVNDTQTLLGEVFVAMDSEGGVEGILDDSGKVSYYSVTGMPVANPEKGKITIVVKDGKAKKVIF